MRGFTLEDSASLIGTILSEGPLRWTTLWLNYEQAWVQINYIVLWFVMIAWQCSNFFTEKVGLLLN